MGNPLHYSLELPQRCLQLIDELWPHAERVLQRDSPDLGSLTTTFLMAMSMPIVNFPVERIERHRAIPRRHYADDRHVHEGVTTAVLGALGAQQLKSAPFYVSGAWSFLSCPGDRLFNIADGLPVEVADQLSKPEAAERAAKLPASQWCSILRNSMSHGGIGYLDNEGRSSYGRSVTMYVFVSGKYDRERPGELIGLNLLRINEANYREFLRKWVGWLTSTRPEISQGTSRAHAAPRVL
jgi:hypothetical protein